MSKHDFTALRAQYPAIIAQMDDTFTSHEFILRLARANQTEYVEALYAYKDSQHENVKAPFKVVHGILSSHLHDFPQLVRHYGDEPHSTDIFGQSNGCGRWKKV